MKAILLCLAAAAVLTGCASDTASDAERTSVKFGNGQYREDGNERPAQPATDRDQNVW